MPLGLTSLGLTPLGLALEQEDDDGVTATASITEAADTVSAAATVPVDGAATATEAGDSASGAAAVPVESTAGITEAGDTASGSSEVPVTASATISEGADTVSGAATVDSDEVLVTATITEAGDSASGAAAVPIAAAGSVTEGGDTVSGAATSESDPRYARPQSDLSAGAWVPSSGSALYAMLDEPSADSADYISTTSASTCEVKLNPVVDPGTSTGQVVRYQAWSPDGNGLTVRLKQGATVIASWAHASLPTTPTVFAQALSAAECDSITNYADLRFAFEAV